MPGTVSRDFCTHLIYFINLHEYDLLIFFCRSLFCTCGYVPYFQYGWLCWKSIVWYFSVGEYPHFNTTCNLFTWIIKYALLQPKGKPWLVIFMSLIRGIFIPVFMVCNAQPRHHLPVYIHNDIYYILITIVFAVSNGYLCNLTFILVPTWVFSVKNYNIT